jgi:hypothetical protein
MARGDLPGCAGSSGRSPWRGVGGKRPANLAEKVLMVHSYYTLGPLILQVISPDGHQQTALARCWQRLFQARSGPDGGQAGPFLLDLTAGPEMAGLWAEHPARAEEVKAASAAWQEDGWIWLRTGESWLAIEAERARALGRITPDFWDLSLVAQRDFFQRLFFLLARRLGAYLLHANALYTLAGGAEAGLLLVGEGATGKTTLSLSLIRAGWGYVGDDVVLLDGRSEGDVDAYGVRRGFACTQESAARWPDWADLLATGIPLNRHKRWLDLDKYYPGRAAAHCRPQVLLFLTLTGQAQTTLHALDQTPAFLRLLDHTGAGILIEPETTPALLALLQRLVAQTRAYHLHPGRDVYTEPARVAALLESLLV